MSLCWPLQMPPTPKAVLISLADNANDQGVCWPSIATISERTCFSERAVQNAIKWLESVGALRADRSNGRHTSYTVTPALFRGETCSEFHYVYKIVHKPSGKFYIGVRTSLVSPSDDDYFGSGACREWLESERANCVKEILGEFPSRREAASAESLALQVAISDQKCLNRKVTNPENAGGGRLETPAADAPRISSTPHQMHHTPAGDAPDPRRRCVGPPQEVPTNRKEPSLEPSGNRKGKERDDLIGISELVDDGVDARHAKDWLTLRKAKRLPLTPSAWSMTKDEAAKVGLSPAQAVAAAVGSNWVGFKAAWWQRAQGVGQPTRASPPSRQSESDRRINEFLNGTTPDDSNTIDMETIR